MNEFNIDRNDLVEMTRECDWYLLPKFLNKIESALKLQELVKEKIKELSKLEDKDTLYDGHIRLLDERDNLQSLIEESEK